MTTRIDCSEAGFGDRPRQPAARRARGPDWQLHAVYWRNKRLGHPKAVGLLVRYARAWGRPQSLAAKPP